MKIHLNRAKCAHCGIELTSSHRNDFKTHVCLEAGKIRKSFNHVTKEYEPDYPHFGVDGGLAYLRRVYTDESDFVEMSITD